MLLRPKSTILMFLCSSNSRFSGFKSRWTTFILAKESLGRWKTLENNTVDCVLHLLATTYCKLACWDWPLCKV